MEKIVCSRKKCSATSIDEGGRGRLYGFPSSELWGHTSPKDEKREVDIALTGKGKKEANSEPSETKFWSIKRLPRITEGKKNEEVFRQR